MADIGDQGRFMYLIDGIVWASDRGLFIVVSCHSACIVDTTSDIVLLYNKQGGSVIITTCSP